MSVNTGLREAFWSSRPISWINTSAPFLLASLLSGQKPLITAIGTIYFLFPYNVLLYGINDIFDFESDIKNPRKGIKSVEGSIVAKPAHNRLWRWIALTNLPYFGLFLTIGTARAKIWFVFLIFMAVAYSLKYLRFKEIPFLDSITSSTHFYSPFVFGLLLAGSSNFYWPALIAFGLWGMASHAFGAIQDITFDRDAGIGSIGTYLGVRATLIFCLVLYVLAAVIPAIYYGALGISAGVALSLYIINAVPFLRIKSDSDAPETNKGWKNFLWLNIVAGFWLTQMLLLEYNPFRLTPLGIAVYQSILTITGLLLLYYSFRRVFSATRA